MSSNPTLHTLTHGAEQLLYDLLAQTLNLIVSVEREIKAINRDKFRPLKAGHRGSHISVRALKSSIILIQFGILEALANFVADLTVRLHGPLEGAVDLASPLTQVELDILREQRTTVDIRTGELKTQHAVFVSTLDKLSVAPLLLAKSHSKTFRLDKGCAGWNKVRKLKDMRDALTHVRLHIRTESDDVESPTLDLDRVRPSLAISSADLFDGSTAISWYLRELMRAFTDLGSYEPVVSMLTKGDFIVFMQAVNLKESARVPDARLKELFPNIELRRQFD